MRFLVFLDTSKFYEEEPNGARSGFTVEDICFGIAAFGIALLVLGIAFSSVMLAVAGLSVAIMVIVAYVALRVFERFLEEQSTF